MNKPNYPALAAISVALISTFLPWVGVDTINSEGGQPVVMSSFVTSGIQNMGGLICLPASLIGAFLAYKNEKFAVVAGVVNVTFGLLHMLHKIGYPEQKVGYIEMKILNLYGLHAFTAASMVFILLSLKNLMASGAQREEKTGVPSE